MVEKSTSQDREMNLSELIAWGENVSTALRRLDVRAAMCILRKVLVKFANRRKKSCHSVSMLSGI